MVDESFLVFLMMYLIFSFTGTQNNILTTSMCLHKEHKLLPARCVLPISSKALKLITVHLFF
jgi:hypothetical protein